MARRRSRSRRWQYVRRTFAALAALVAVTTLYTWATLPDVRRLRTERPDRTAFMKLREAEARRAGEALREVWIWTPYDRISPNLKRAVLVTEDAAFWTHNGFDLSELRASIETAWETGGPLRGASTITQQLAKNLYLSPSRNPYRKIEEALITRRLEAELSKTRIFELYLNVVEWGDGVWGAEAAARAHFGQSASSLSREQAALLAGALINPRIYSPSRPNARLRARQRIILGRMGPERGEPRGTPPADAPPLPITPVDRLPEGPGMQTLPGPRTGDTPQ